MNLVEMIIKTVKLFPKWTDFLFKRLQEGENKHYNSGCEKAEGAVK